MNEIYHCDHETTEVRVKTTINKQKQYRRQCLKCGANTESLKKAVALEENPEPPEFDDQLKSDWLRTRSELATAEYEAKRKVESESWWDEYQAYLQSEDWQNRRGVVLQRDRHTCQACLRRKATQVHHTTYKYGTAAPLFALISLCSECHDHITLIDREKRKGAAIQ